MLIEDVTNSEISALTRTLQLLPGENAVTYAGRVMSSISVLDSHLKRPNRVSSLILPSQKLFTPLCKLHKPLNASVVHALFNLVALEAGGRLNSLVSNNHKLTETERARVQSLRELHSLWLEPDVYQKTFFELPNWEKWKYQADECEACMLARIGGDMTVLLTLRMALLSRMSSKKLRRYGPPRLMCWIERWVATLSVGMRFSSEQFEKMISENDQDGKALKEIRKQLWHERRESQRAFRANQQKQNRRSTQVSGGDISAPQSQPEIRVSAATTNTFPQPFVEDGDSASDYENDLIDHYNFLTSTAYLPSIASTISLPHHPTKPELNSLTKHPNAGVPTSLFPPVRPQPTNFQAAAAQGLRDRVYRSKSQGHCSSSSSLKPLTPPKDESCRESHYGTWKPLSPADSYVPPKFSVHPAYIPPTAAANARRYRHLLSPHPLLRGSEEELAIPESQAKGAAYELPAQVPVQDSKEDRVSTFTVKEASDWESINVNRSSVSSLGRSKTTREPSRLSSVSETSLYGDYRDGAANFPRPASTFTLKEATTEVEPRWDANRERSDARSRAKGIREHSRASTVSTASSYPGSSRERRKSGETSGTRMSDLFQALMDETKRGSQ
jgi:hypothetical protein